MNPQSDKIRQEVTVTEIAKLTGGQVLGDGNALIFGVCALDEPHSGCITFVRDTDPVKILARVRGIVVRAVFVPSEADLKIDGSVSQVFIRVANPLQAICTVAKLFHGALEQARGIHPKSEVHSSAVLGKDVSIGAYVVIGERAVIGDSATIYPHVVIYPEAVIGTGAIIHSGAVIRERCRVGDNCIVQNGAVIGSEGFGYYLEEGVGLRSVPQLGTAVLADRVDIGANTCVDRATLGTTRIGANTKLDNLVQIGHNVRIGSNSILCGLVGIAGSVKVGDRVTLAGNVGVADHLEIASDVRIAAKAGVTNSVLEKGDYAGYPLSKAGVWRRQMSALTKLPELLRILKFRSRSRELSQVKGKDGE